ncbi:MAG: M14 family metallopeptidase [Bacteroidota bacterium]
MLNRLKLLIPFLLFFACNQGKIPETEGPPSLVNTETRPINKQWKGIWAFQDSSVFFSNDFKGARLNGLVMDSANHFIALITGENYPINPSPWYAFQVWSKESKEITVKLTYTESRSRYYPKISYDGENFQPVDSSKVIGFEGTGWGIDHVPETIEMTLDVSSDTLWIAAQELWTSSEVKSWMDELSVADNIDQYTIGTSREGKPIWMMQIGNRDAKKSVIIISRQHPPEVTGFLAMKSFIETLSGDSEQALRFKKAFSIFNVPLMNPDGVDNGHWRHNSGGIDLNRDWQEFNQPETSAVKSFIEQKKKEGVEFVFAADFHSTWEDIYYPLDSSLLKSNELFIYDWVDQIASNLSIKNPNVKPSLYLKPTMVSRNYFYHDHQIPGIVFELGDNTERAFLARKGKVAAEELMKILIDRLN